MCWELCAVCTDRTCLSESLNTGLRFRKIRSHCLCFILDCHIFFLHSLVLQHLSYGNGSLHVDAAFQQTLWSVAPICSGSEVAQGTPVCFLFLSFLLHIILSFLLFLIYCLLLVLCFLLSLLPALCRF